jgi:spheroidene monooxygenase
MAAVSAAVSAAINAAGTAGAVQRFDSAAGPAAAGAHDRAGPVRAAPSGTCGPAVSVLLVARTPGLSAAWGWSRVVRGPAALAGSRGLRFAKVMGSGHEGGFGLRPSGDRHGVFATFDDESAADAFLDPAAPLMRAYARHADECFHVKLRAFSCKGTWSGRAVPLSALVPPPDRPLAALTRASIRPASAARFWRLAPPAQAGLAEAEGCRLAVGLGEAPLLRQCTFSLWDSVHHMDRYARGGAHQAAIRAAVQERYFGESMFVRFVPSEARGRWLGRDHGDVAAAA